MVIVYWVSRKEGNSWADNNCRLPKVDASKLKALKWILMKLLQTKFSVTICWIFMLLLYHKIRMAAVVELRKDTRTPEFRESVEWMKTAFHFWRIKQNFGNSSKIFIITIYSIITSIVIPILAILIMKSLIITNRMTLIAFFCILRRLLYFTRTNFVIGFQAVKSASK
jgi:hypothetical protein